MNPSSLENQAPAGVGSNFSPLPPIVQTLPVVPPHPVAQTRVQSWGRAINRIYNLIERPRFVRMAEIAAVIGGTIPESFLIAGAYECKNNPRNWNLCTIKDNFSEDTGGDIYIALAIVYPIIYAVGIYIYRSKC